MPAERALRPALPPRTVFHTDLGVDQLRPDTAFRGEPIGGLFAASAHPCVGERTCDRAHADDGEHDCRADLALQCGLDDADHYAGHHHEREQPARLPTTDSGKTAPDQQARREPPWRCQPRRHQRETGRAGGVVAQLLSAPAADPGYGPTVPSRARD